MVLIRQRAHLTSMIPDSQVELPLTFLAIDPYADLDAGIVRCKWKDLVEHVFKNLLDML